MNKIKTVKIKNEDGSISEESYTIAADAVNIDMANGKNAQETIGTIDVDEDGDIATQLKNKIDKNNIVDNLNSTDANKVLSAKQGKVLRDAITAANLDIQKKMYYFNTIEDMKVADLQIGDACQTLNYYEENDGKGDRYEVVNKNNQLFDIANTWKKIGYYNNSGQFLTNSTSNVSFLLFELPLGKITISSNYDLKKLVGFNNMDYSQGTIITSTVGKLYTFENNGTYSYFATYVTMTGYNQDDFYIMMNKGDIALPYEEYEKIDGIELDNGLIAKKIIDIKKEKSFINQSITIEENTFIDEVTKTKYWITKIPRYNEDGHINELKLGFANDENENLLTPQTARDFSKLKNATLVINAGVAWTEYQGHQYDGANMHGLRVLEHELISNNYENEWYKKTHYALGIKDDGTLITFGTPDNNGDVYQSYEESQELGCKYVTSAFTPIMLNGVSQKNILQYTNQWVDGNNNDIYYQRQVIGQNSKTKDIFILTSNGKGTAVIDGLTIDKGMTLDDCITILQELNCDFAYQLDEGGSTSLVYRNKLINDVTDNYGTTERLLSDFLYVSQEIYTDKDKDIFENQKTIGDLKQYFKKVPTLDITTGNLNVINGIMGFFPASLKAIYNENNIPKYSSVFIYYRTANNAPYATNNAVCLSLALWNADGNQMLQIAFPHAGDPTSSNLKPKYRTKTLNSSTQQYTWSNWFEIG